MFVVQVDFSDGVTQVETVFVSRLFLRVGTSDNSHLILEGVKKLPYEIAIIRGLGDDFTCKAIWSDPASKVDFDWEKQHHLKAEIRISNVSVVVNAISAAVAQHVMRSRDQSSALKDLELASSLGDGVYPAFISTKSPRVCLSVPGVDQIFIGNTRNCFLRFETFREKKEFARISKVSLGMLEIVKIHPQEVIKVNNNIISDRLVLNPRDRISFSSGPELVFLTSEDDLQALSDELPDFVSFLKTEHRRNLRSIAGPITPGFLPLSVGQTISIGRDPGHNVWIDAPFISRLHCTIHVEQEGYVFTDFSSNGIEINGKKLIKGKQEFFPNSIIELSFGYGTSILISDYDEKAAKEYLKSSESNTVLSRLSEETLSEDLENNKAKEDSVVTNNYREDVALEREWESEKNESLGVTEAILKSKSQESNMDFDEFQRKSLKIHEDLGDQFFADDYPGEIKEESPIRVGFSKYLPQIFIATLIFVIAAFLIILATNFIR